MSNVKGRKDRPGARELGNRVVGLFWGSAVMVCGLLDGAYNTLPHVDAAHVIYAGAALLGASVTGQLKIGKP